jgi:superfamily I DNA/RNA helicase
MSYYFNLPIIDDLTIDQQAAVDETDAFALSGGPGTGKSVVCLWRHIRNYAINGDKSLLLTYTKTLEHYLKQCANKKSSDAANNIDRTFNWIYNHRSNYDEIIIDEGQDVGIDKYQTIKRYANTVSYGADDAQSLFKDGSTPKQLEELFPDNEEYTLSRNFRNSKEILEFTRSVFSNFLIPQETINNAPSSGQKPIMKVVGWDDVVEITKIINRFAGSGHNIGVLFAGHKDLEKYYELIKQSLPSTLNCSKYDSDMDNFEGLSGIHLTTFKSSKGTEFDTVIIPKFDSMDWMLNKTSGRITEKDYYVAFTRAKKNLFLICKDNLGKGDSSTFNIE